MDESRQRHTILIVDDHPATVRLLQDILEADYNVLCAGNGKEALALAKSTPGIDLVLLDIIMPELNGYEACKELKADETLHDIPVIFLTVMDEERDEVLGFNLGVTDYIIKPISRLRLLARVKNQLQLKSQQQLLVQKNKELQAALDQIKTLQGILPICSFCKQIRNDKGYWEKIETFIQANSEAEFTHSVCPNCAKKHYPEFQ